MKFPELLTRIIPIVSFAHHHPHRANQHHLLISSLQKPLHNAKSVTRTVCLNFPSPADSVLINCWLQLRTDFSLPVGFSRSLKDSVRGLELGGARFRRRTDFKCSGSRSCEAAALVSCLGAPNPVFCSSNGMKAPNSLCFASSGCKLSRWAPRKRRSAVQPWCHHCSHTKRFRQIPESPRSRNWDRK